MHSGKLDQMSRRDYRKIVMFCEIKMTKPEDFTLKLKDAIRIKKDKGTYPLSRFKSSKTLNQKVGKGRYKEQYKNVLIY